MTAPFAELLERAEVYAKYLAEVRVADLLYDSTNNWGTTQEIETAKRIAAADAARLRTLATAMREAKPYDFDTQHRDDQFILTLPEAP